MIDKLNEALAESLGDAMDCLRVWEATTDGRFAFCSSGRFVGIY